VLLFFAAFDGARRDKPATVLGSGPPRQNRGAKPGYRVKINEFKTLIVG
jgi:hypothetical protein